MHRPTQRSICCTSDTVHYLLQLRRDVAPTGKRRATKNGHTVHVTCMRGELPLSITVEFAALSQIVSRQPDHVIVRPATRFFQALHILRGHPLHGGCYKAQRNRAAYENQQPRPLPCCAAPLRDGSSASRCRTMSKPTALLRETWPW